MSLSENKNMLLENLKKILFLTLLLTVSLLLYFLSSYFIFVKKETKPKEGPVVTATESGSLQKFSTETSEKNQEVYVDAVTKELETPNIPEEKEKNLLFKKAIVLSVVRSSDKEKTLEANTALKDFIVNKAETPTDLYYKDYALVAFLKLNFQNRLFNGTDTVFPGIFKKNKEVFHDDSLATLFSLKDIANMVSNERKNDTAFVAISLAIETEILSNYSDNLSKEIKNNLLFELKNNLALYDKSEAKTFKEEYTVLLESALFYAYAYDTYHSQETKNISKEINESINSNYDKVFTLLNDSQYEDKISINLMKVFNSIRYIASIKKRNLESYNEDKLNKIAKEAVNAMNYSQETKLVSSMYLKANVTNGYYKNWSYFIALRTKVPEIDAFLKSTNL